MPSSEFLELIGSILVTEEVTTTTINVIESDDVTTVTVTEQVTENPTMVVENASYEVARVTAAVGEANDLRDATEVLKDTTEGIYDATVLVKTDVEGIKTDVIGLKGDVDGLVIEAEKAKGDAEDAANEALGYRDEAMGAVDDVAAFTEIKKGELNTHTTTKKTEIDSYINTVSKVDLDGYVLSTLKPDLDAYRINTVQPAIDTYRTGTVQPAIDTYRTTTVQPAIDAYVDATTKPSIDAYASAQAATVVQPLVDKAEQWAEETEDVEVETGKYSAKHYAAKAEDEAATLASSITTLNEIDTYLKDKIFFGCYTIAEIDAMIADGYVPIATPADFGAISSTSSRTFGTGTPWEASYTTTGLLGKYIQVQDIDMYFDTQDPLGAYYNSGLGFTRMATFKGVYDGGGRVLKNLKLTNGIWNTGSSAIVRNWGIEDCIAIATVNWNGIMFANNPTNCLVEKCFITGIKDFNTVLYSGVFCGREEGAIRTIYRNCISVVQMIGSTGNYVGTFIGWGGAGELRNSFVLGTISKNNSSSLYPITYTPNTEFNTFFNKDTNETKTPSASRTTEELYTFDENNLDGNVWEFKPNRYPILKVFGERSWNRIQPINLQSYLDDEGIHLNWTSSFVKPQKFNIYASVYDGTRWLMWEKIGDTEDYEFIVETIDLPLNPQHIKFFVKGEYN